MLRRALPCLLALPLLPALAAAPPLLRSEGIARSADGAVLYREVHWQRGAADGSERWVVYQCPDGTPFARKQMPASGQPQARGYQLQDARSGQRASVLVAHDGVALDWQEQAGATAQRAQLPLPADAVIDAGFDAALRLHWAALLRGEAVSLPFLVPGRQRYYSVQVRRTGAVEWEGQSAQAMRVRLDAWYGAAAPACRWCTPMPTGACWNSVAPATCATPPAATRRWWCALPAPSAVATQRRGSANCSSRWCSAAAWRRDEPVSHRLPFAPRIVRVAASNRAAYA
ncbi:MAG: hypothetical protein GAK31_00265 [Stenotrophomonas maltophilia]|uniref:Uncharacterized protein n=1 Tax=Stenotrophomonas maltophilia TaxID=40324 RepID=A0A7V8JN50_STEMA|nr:MAG: hypothetical protein GAK31_00265 [Stenotrophomonas maltophilia]